jgi:hypothetical protein
MAGGGGNPKSEARNPKQIQTDGKGWEKQKAENRKQKLRREADRNIGDRKMGVLFIFLSCIFLSLCFPRRFAAAREDFHSANETAENLCSSVSIGGSLR